MKTKKKCGVLNLKKTIKRDRKIIKMENKKLKYFLGDDLLKNLFKEFKSRTKESYKTFPVLVHGLKYYFKIEKGQGYGVHYVIDCNNKHRKILNLEEMSKGHKFFNLIGPDISNDGKNVCYMIDYKGDRKFSLYWKPVFAKNHTLLLDNISPGCLWCPYSFSIYYVEHDKVDMRPHKIYKIEVATGKRHLIYYEKDRRYQIGVSSTSDHKHVIIWTSCRTNTDFTIITSCGLKQPFKRRPHHFYSIDKRGEHWYVLEKINGQSKIKTSRDLQDFTTLFEFNKEIQVRFFDLKNDYLLIHTRESGNLFLYVYYFCDQKVLKIQFMKHRHHFFLPYSYNLNFNSHDLYVKYSSYTIPRTLMKINLKTKENKVLSYRKFPGYEPEKYAEKIVMVNDKLAMTMLYKKTNPLKKEKCVLYGYGSYGITIESEFSKYIPSLLERGFIYCFAHIRGSKYHGYSWYKDGKLLNKKNTFYDFIDCAKYLIQRGYTIPSRLAIWGRSAGGLLIGSTINYEPSLFQLAILGVPFVDVIDTMTNDCQPLTTEEYEEWGNPSNAQLEKYMRSYSPIDNINLSSDYPNIYIYSNVEDSLVPYKSVLNYFEKIKEADVFKSGKKQIVLDIDDKYGHGQATERYESMQEMAKMYAVILNFII